MKDIYQGEWWIEKSPAFRGRDIQLPALPFSWM